MLKIFLSVAAYLRRRREAFRAIEEYAEEREKWCRDPLSHPDIAAMSQRELADLPFRRDIACRR
ncbi:hypothetical protein [Chelativorans sp. M5D2P16]|uniref:hypothetical protein n=1 Tax=Chelativorans sp. M5D2P16 TaxID=3095678 RepID=UPI002ACAC9AB|nr:hypothetical protein [Chelativorans sp. M5D2P16]MDZ5697976.1 hypothetical protein [Chelativorans sp. M5D2P16]